MMSTSTKPTVFSKTNAEDVPMAQSSRGKRQNRDILNGAVDHLSQDCHNAQLNCRRVPHANKRAQ
jgi:hypothetical protein